MPPRPECGFQNRKINEYNCEYEVHPDGTEAPSPESEDDEPATGPGGFNNGYPKRNGRLSLLLAVLLAAVMIEPIYHMVLSFLYFDTGAESLMLKPSFPGNILGLVSSVSGNAISVLPWLLLVLLTIALTDRFRRKKMFALLKCTSLAGVIAAVAAAVSTASSEIYHASAGTGNENILINWVGAFFYVMVIAAGVAAAIIFYIVTRKIEFSFLKGDI
ncbi:MAG: hypothetical protein JXA49_03055 [Actinobacteria bacterium]|nr:hypothetical protein [Actinomycetota bacterium]